MPRSVPAVLIIALSLGLVAAASAQSHFSSCLDGQGNIFNATIIIPAESRPTVNGNPLPSDSEVAVFTTDPGFPNRCVGVMTLSGESSAITIWGDDSITPERDGLIENEPFVFKVWDSALNFEYPSAVISSSFPIYERRYTNDKPYILNDLSVFWTMAGVTVQDDLISIDEDTPAVVDVVANDASSTGGMLHVYQVGTPEHGTASITIDGRVEYSPNPNFFGTDSFFYYATAGSGNIGQGMIYVEVLSVNDAPVIGSSPPLGATVGIPYFFSLAGSDVDEDPLQFISESLPEWLSFTPKTSLVANLTGIPSAEHIGVSEIKVGISDGIDSTWVPFALTIQGIEADNQAPLAIDDVFSVPEDSTITISLLMNDTDPDGDTLFVSSVDPIQNGSLQALTDGQYVFTPSPDFNGIVSFEYSASDSSGAIARGSVQITVTPGNDAAVFSTEPVSATVAFDSDYIYAVQATDIDGDPLEFLLIIAPEWLSIADAGDGSAVLQGNPGQDHSGIHPVTIEVSDGTVSTYQEFEIVVSAAPPPPPPPLSVPVAPLILDEGNNFDVPRTPTLNWSIVSSANHYNVQIAKGRAADFSFNMVVDSTTQTNSIESPRLARLIWYSWRVRAGNDQGYGDWSQPASFVTADDPLPGDPGEAPDPSDGKSTLPETVQLLQNYPNPFNPETTIVFELPSRMRAQIEIFDLLGHFIRTLVDETLEGGRHEVKWRALDLPSGIYIHRLQAGNSVKSRTLSLVK